MIEINGFVYENVCEGIKNPAELIVCGSFSFVRVVRLPAVILLGDPLISRIQSINRGAKILMHMDHPGLPAVIHAWGGDKT